MEKIYGKKGIVLPEKLVIPNISDEQLRILYKKLKPIATINEIKYLLKTYALQDLRYTSYIWTQNEDKRKIINPNDLEFVEDFLCLHEYGYYGFFKPSIAEILAQVPDNVIKNANTFEIIESPETREDVFRYNEVVENGYHLSKVRAYYLKK